MMSQIDFTAELTDCCEFSRLPLPLAGSFSFADFFLAMVIRSKSSLKCWAEQRRGHRVDCLKLLEETTADRIGTLQPGFQGGY